MSLPFHRGAKMAAMLILLPLLLIAGQAEGDPSITNNRVPTAAVISELESKLKLPTEASPLSAYTRFYTEVDIAGRDAIVGQLIDSRIITTNAAIQRKPTPPPLNRVLEADLTPVFDGGCMAVNVMYDVQAKGVPTAVCNPPGPGGH